MFNHSLQVVFAAGYIYKVLPKNVLSNQLKFWNIFIVYDICV